MSDKEGIIIKTNKEYSRVLGALEKDILGKHVSYFEKSEKSLFLLHIDSKSIFSPSIPP